MRNKLFAGIAAGFMIAAGAAVPAQALSATKADLYVLHAVPGLTVDVWVNGSVLLEDFAPGTLTSAVELAPGDYSVAVTAPNAALSSAVIGPVTLTLAANTSYTAVAHLDAAGDPTASLFTNDLSTIPAGQGKLTVRHVAEAPAVDVLANGAVAFSNLANPNEVKANLAAGTISAAVAATGTTTPVIGPTNVEIKEGVNTIVYAWGSLEGDSLDLAVQTFSGLHSSPKGVPSGTGGMAAEQNTVATLGGMALLAALGVAAIAAGRLRVAKQSSR